jgi:hypothetical protein
MRSAMAHDKRRDVWELQLRVKRRLAPLQLAFDLHLPGACCRRAPLAAAD